MPDQILKAVRRADQDASKSFYLGEQVFGMADFPISDSPAANEKERIRIVHNQYGILRFCLGKNLADILFSLAHIGAYNVAGSLDHKFSFQMSGNLARQFTISCVRRTVEKKVEVSD
jgi:hypothetical protein